MNDMKGCPVCWSKKVWADCEDLILICQNCGNIISVEHSPIFKQETKFPVYECPEGPGLGYKEGSEWT